MNILERLESLHNTMLQATKETLEMSLQDVHHPGIFSLVIAGTEPGNLTRVFIADKKLKPFEVQFHTHRYPIWLTSIRGNIRHYEAKIPKHAPDVIAIEMPCFEYRSPLNGGTGLKYLKDKRVEIIDYGLPPGSTIYLSSSDYHTMSCSKGSIWIVEEQGFKTDTSKVLGIPFITEGLYNKPEMFQVNDKFQLVKTEIKRMIDSFKAIQ